MDHQSILRDSHYARSEEAKKLIITDAHGPYLITDEGEEYLDFSSGWCVGNLGWKHPAITKALKKFDGPSYVSPHLEYGPWIELSRILSEIAPGKLTKCFRATGGTEAVEIALQAAMAFTGREEFIGIEKAYHGNSIAARALNEDSPFFSWKKIKSPLTSESLKELERLLKNKRVAAFIMEPVSMNLDVRAPEPEFMTGLQELCRKYGTLIIMDEVACGFGRTGKLFASEYFEIEPDIMCLAKALSSGHAAIGATLMRKDIGEALVEKEYPYSTFGWHPLSVVAALETVKFYRDNWKDLDDNIRSLNAYFRQRLSEMDFKEQPEMRMMGMAMHLEFKKSKYGDRIEERAFKKKLILAGGVSMYPPLTLDFKDAKKGLDILEECL